MSTEIVTVNHQARAHSPVEARLGSMAERQLISRSRPVCSVRELRERLMYDPLTGVVTWRTTVGARTRVGSVVGWANDQGYLKFKIGTTAYYLSRAIWAYVHGYWPEQLVDHINGNKSDNRLCNLRLATNSQNCRNSKARRAGLKGVTWSVAANKWAAQIGYRLYGRKVNEHLGLFETEQEAHLAYCAAASAEFGEYARFE